MTSDRTRRVILLFLLILTIVVFIRIASSAEGATPVRAAGAPPVAMLRLLEQGGLLEGGSTLRRTVELTGIRPESGPVEIDWQALLDGSTRASGRVVVNPKHAQSGVPLSIPIPEVDRPAGLDLRLQAGQTGAGPIEASFPFLVYPKGAVESLASLFGRARVALYDPAGAAAPILESLGVRPERFATFEPLALYSGNLIVVGPGGFSRGHEALGPILAAQVRAGTHLLLLGQTTLPATLSEDLRLWPSFSVSGSTDSLSATRHPVLRGVSTSAAAVVRAPSTGPSVRPLLPPTRGNFRVLSEIRVKTGPEWQEGVTLLELPLGAGTILVAQSSLCDDYVRSPKSRLLVSNALAYLLGAEGGMKRSFLYGRSLDDIPACVARLAPGATRLPADFAGVEVLLVAGDWRAQRVAAASGLPHPAEVARYLHEGGTIVLLNPQPLSIDYLQAVTGIAVYFEKVSDTGPPPDPATPLLEGIAAEDLGSIARDGHDEFRLRPPAGRNDVEPLLLLPGIAQYRVGRGTLAALTLPGAGVCATARVSSLLARLLTNLGVPLDHAPGLDPDTVSQLDE